MKCGLVLEGGARRCMFTAAIIDKFIEEGIDLPYVVGVSAGAQAAMNYVSKQQGRFKEVLADDTDKPLDLRNLRDAFSDELRRATFEVAYTENPFDFKAYFSSNTDCEITVTSAETGKAEYISEKENETRLLEALMASGALPIMFPIMYVDEKPYVDGTIADPVPFERAFEVGCDKAIVVLTKSDEELVADYRKSRPIVARLYEEEYPALYQQMMDFYDVYNDQTKRLYELEKEGKVLIIKPDKSYVWAFESSKDKLDEIYDSAKKQVEDRLDEIRKFLQA